MKIFEKMVFLPALFWIRTGASLKTALGSLGRHAGFVQRLDLSPFAIRVPRNRLPYVDGLITVLFVGQDTHLQGKVVRPPKENHPSANNTLLLAECGANCGF
jgi:hypothetical protein